MTVREALLFFCKRESHRFEAARDGRCWAWLSEARPVCDNAVGRRGAASKAGSFFIEAIERNARCTYLTSRRPGCTFDDINKLLAAFRQLIEAGGSIVIIEHNLDSSERDWLIDLGPGRRG